MTTLNIIWLIIMAAMILFFGMITCWLYLLKKPEDFTLVEQLPLIEDEYPARDKKKIKPPFWKRTI